MGGMREIKRGREDVLGAKSRLLDTWKKIEKKSKLFHQRF